MINWNYKYSRTNWDVQANESPLNVMQFYAMLMTHLHSALHEFRANVRITEINFANYNDYDKSLYSFICLRNLLMRSTCLLISCFNHLSLFNYFIILMIYPSIYQCIRLLNHSFIFLHCSHPFTRYSPKQTNKIRLTEQANKDKQTEYQRSTPKTHDHVNKTN